MCISILHDPGEDKFGYERPEERWLPIHTVETILVSVISMLADPNDESPANLDAAVSIDGHFHNYWGFCGVFQGDHFNKTSRENVVIGCLWHYLDVSSAVCGTTLTCHWLSVCGTTLTCHWLPVALP